MKVRKGAKKGALMKEHAFLECALVDAAFANDPDLVGQVGALLDENIRSQALLYGSMFKGFPEEEFKSLMGQHVGAFVKETGCRMNKQTLAADDCLKSLMGNSVSLAALTAEWF